jgi:hypothetical protein
MNCRVIYSLICALCICASVSRAATYNIATNQGTGQDGMVYANTSVPFPLSTFYPVIAVGATGGPHDTVSLTQFDLSSVGATSAEVTSATLRVYSTSSKAVNATNLDPDASHPVEVGVSPITSGWNRAAVTWATRPSHGAVENTFAADALGEFFTVDVTDIVKGWLDTPASNFGLWLEATTIMGSGPNQDQSPFYAIAFNSGFLPSPPGGLNDNAPLLTINTVPEPSTVVLSLLGVCVFGGRCLRRLRKKLV